MDEIRFQTEVGEDQTIHIPPGATIPSGIVEITVRKCTAAKESDESSAFPKREDYASVGEWLHAVGKHAETWDVDLPSDMAANHDFYAHGKPRT